MKVAVLYSGGKDSHYAMLKAIEEGHELACLVTVVPRRVDSYMFHTYNIRWSFLHGLAIGVPQVAVEVSGDREREVEELLHAVGKLKELYGFDGVVSGVVASRYQKERVDHIAERVGLVHLSPLWGRDQGELLREESRRLKFILTAAMAMGLRPEHLGVVITPEAAEGLILLSRKHGFSPVGEGGEFETYVVESPLFVIEVRGERYWREAGWGYFEIREAKIIKRAAT
ncbi:MAG: diphthine--ammonia ligase [Pyrobaculum sp.]